MSKLTEKFIKGLQKYNLNVEDIKKFKYCGGNQGRHYNYFKLFFEETLKKNPGWYPELKNECICDHHIQENCYIINNSGLILTIGNCCIKKFILKKYRTCEICECPHKNRIVNKCNDCRNKEYEKTIKFGKYKGETYENIFIKDVNYIRWLLTQDWFNKKDYIKELLKNSFTQINNE